MLFLAEPLVHRFYCVVLMRFYLNLFLDVSKKRARPNIYVFFCCHYLPRALFRNT